MSVRLRRYLTFSNVTSVVALVFALGLGTAWALERNSVESKHIVNGQVKGEDVNEASLDRVARGGSKLFGVFSGDEDPISSTRDGKILLQCDSTPRFRYKDTAGDAFPSDLWTLGPGAPTHQQVPDGGGPVALPDDGGDPDSISLIVQPGGEGAWTVLVSAIYNPGPEDCIWSRSSLFEAVP